MHILYLHQNTLYMYMSQNKLKIKIYNSSVHAVR